MTETNQPEPRAPEAALEAFDAFFDAHGAALLLLAPSASGWRYYQAGAAYGAGEERTRLTEQLAAAEGRAQWSREVPTVEGEYLHLNRTAEVVPEVLLLEWIDLDGDGQQLAVDDWGESAEDIGGWWMPFTRPPAAPSPAEEEPDHAG